MKNYESRNNSINSVTKIIRFLAWIIFPLWVLGGFSQVTATIDSTTVEIGQEIRYKMQVEADSTQIVVFPEGNTFIPLEVIESRKIDTSRNGKRFSLIKEYALTQFDSGHYTIPIQKVLVGDKVFFTDSLKVEIRDVLVDTTKQKMYEIKPLVEVEASNNWWSSLKDFLKSWIFIFSFIAFILITLIILVYFFFLKKKIRNKKNDLPPYERAILALRKIDESHLLEQDSHKEYYSQLSDTARKYIDEEVYDHAMESTTDELITRLDEEIKSGHLNLDKTTIEELKKVLKTADMAKFAKSKPDVITAKADRNVIEQVIHKTKSAIPEPTEEELLADEEYRKAVAEKKRRKKIGIGSAVVVVLILGTWIGFGWAYGFDVVKDTLLGHPTKELAESDWITSAYGSPPVTISTPKVLIRNAYQMTEEQQQILKGNETFLYGSLIGNFYVVVSTIQYNKPTTVDLEKAVEGTVGAFEAQGAKNISLKNEEYETLGGAKGIKVFGSLEVVNPVTKKEQKNDYLILNFAEGGGFQQITVVYNIEDRYAKDVAERIINSVELKNDK